MWDSIFWVNDYRLAGDYWKYYSQLYDTITDWLSWKPPWPTSLAQAGSPKSTFSPIERVKGERENSFWIRYAFYDENKDSSLAKRNYIDKLRAEVKKINYHPIWSYLQAAEGKKEKSIKIFYIFITTFLQLFKHHTIIRELIFFSSNNRAKHREIFFFFLSKYTNRQAYKVAIFIDFSERLHDSTTSRCDESFFFIIFYIACFNYLQLITPV